MKRSDDFQQQQQQKLPPTENKTLLICQKSITFILSNLMASSSTVLLKECVYACVWLCVQLFNLKKKLIFENIFNIPFCVVSVEG